MIDKTFKRNVTATIVGGVISGVLTYYIINKLNERKK